MAVDALGNPLRLILTAGQIADIDCAQKLIQALGFGALVADNGYDSDALVRSIETGNNNNNRQAVIPP